MSCSSCSKYLQLIDVVTPLSMPRPQKCFNPVNSETDLLEELKSLDTSNIKEAQQVNQTG